MPGDRYWVVGERISHIHPIMYLVQYTSYSVHRTVSRVHCTFSKQYSVRSTPIKKHVNTPFASIASYGQNSVYPIVQVVILYNS